MQSSDRSARRHEQRRTEIIRAAYRVLAEVGYEAASIKEIARAADVAPGLIHYYFATKEDLLVAVVEALSAEGRARFQALREEVDKDALGSSAFALSLSRLKSETDMIKLRIELFALALRNEAVRKEVLKILRGRLESISATVKSARAEPRFAEGFAKLIDAMLDGLALRAALDESYDPAPAYRVLDELSKAALRERPKRARKR
jgi:AcrR family transcriptional regulator